MWWDALQINPMDKVNMVSSPFWRLPISMPRVKRGYK